MSKPEKHCPTCNDLPSRPPESVPIRPMPTTDFDEDDFDWDADEDDHVDWSEPMTREDFRELYGDGGDDDVKVASPKKRNQPCS